MGPKHVNGHGESRVATDLCIMETTKIIGRTVQLPSSKSVSKSTIGHKLVSKVIIPFLKVRFCLLLIIYIAMIHAYINNFFQKSKQLQKLQPNL